MRPLNLWTGCCGLGAAVAAWVAWSSGNHGVWAIALALGGIALVWMAAGRAVVSSRAGRAARAAAVVLATVLLLVAGAAGAAWFGSETMVWSVDGVADGGSSVVIGFPDGYSPCRGEPQIAVLEQSRERVEIRVRLRYQHCGLKSLHFYRPLEVPLRAPLAGRIIAGPSRARSATPVAYHGYLKSHRPMPDLVGLRVSDARAALRSHELDAGPVVGTGATVTGQTPPAGSALPTRPVVIEASDDE